MKRINDDAAGCSDAKIPGAPASDYDWMVFGGLEDCKIAAGRATLAEINAAVERLRENAGSHRKRLDVLYRAKRIRLENGTLLEPHQEIERAKPGTVDIVQRRRICRRVG